MSEFLTNEMLQEMITAVMKGENYDYENGGTSVHVTPNGISISYKYSEPQRDRDIKEFLDYVDKMDNVLFVEVCESFEPGELDQLQKDLDTENYSNAIFTFMMRTKTVANDRMNQILNEAHAEITAQEKRIEKAKAAINEIHKDLETAYARYTL